jgi:hypothetical protein
MSSNLKSVWNVDIQESGVDDLAQYSVAGCPGRAVVLTIPERSILFPLPVCSLSCWCSTGEMSCGRSGVTSCPAVV